MYDTGNPKPVLCESREGWGGEGGSGGRGMCMPMTNSC